LPDRAARPHAITVGTGGFCWFTEWASGRVGRISPDGDIETRALPTPAPEPHGITVGPDGSLWVALEIGSIAHLVPASPRAR
jgi:virginiamycin B lyase